MDLSSLNMDIFHKKSILLFYISSIFDNIVKFDIQLHFYYYSLIDKKNVIIR